LKDRFEGALLGLATGDALGTTLEFRTPGSFQPIDDMIGGGPFHLRPGEWTDDTSMALCLAKSLVECRGFNARDQMTRYIRWYREGYMSSNGYCFDIGNTIAAALQRYEIDGDPFAGETALIYGGNGSLMRLAPVPMAWIHEPEQAIQLSGDSSRTTHGSPEPVDACRYYAGLMVGALQGQPKATLLSSRYHPAQGQWVENRLSPKVDAVAAGSFKLRQPPQIRGSGYVVQALEAALWAFYHSDDFAEGALMAVNLGDDADTTGAIYGQLAGAFYGRSAIPEEWQQKIARSETIVYLANALMKMDITQTKS
jgi:ADP-ribosylglycohydrolase